MVRIIRSVAPSRPDAWVFEAKNTCHECKTEWSIESSDRPVGWWRYLTGLLPNSRYENHGNGPVLVLPYMVKTYPSEAMLPGTWLSSRCPNCGGYCFTPKPETEDRYD